MISEESDMMEGQCGKTAEFLFRVDIFFEK